MCPSCRWHAETQLHMYQCTHPEARQLRSNAFRQMEKYYDQHKIPATVYLPFVRMCRSVCADKPPNMTRNVIPSVQRAMEQQMRLPPEFLLRGLLVSGWHGSGLQQEDPDLMMKHLHLGLWRILFAQVWELRNNPNHRTESIAATYGRNQLLAELSE